MGVTRIRSGWLVAWDGARQRLVERGELIIEGDRVIAVSVDFEGQVDTDVDARGELVLPGFVNAHVHAGSFAVGRLFADTLRREPRALGFLHYAAPRDGAAVPPSAADPVWEAEATLREALRHGCTTVAEVGGETGVTMEAMVEAGAALGVRTFLGRGFRSNDYVTRADGSIGYRPRPDRGAADLERAIATAEALRAAGDPFVRPVLFPLQADTCDPDLLVEAHAAAERLGVPLQVHAAQGWHEYATIMDRTGRTPVAWLDGLGVLTPTTTLAHAVYLSGTSSLPFAADDDLARLAASGAGVVHCPTVLARRGIALESFERYRAKGVRIAVGTDTFPRDPVGEVRLAAYLSRVIDRDPGAGSPWTMLSAITDVPADLLGAPDLGRLAPGARADLVGIRLDRLRHGPIHDPVTTWLHTGHGDDVARVWVGGLVRYHRDDDTWSARERELREDQARAARVAWDALPSWRPDVGVGGTLAAEGLERRWVPQQGTVRGGWGGAM
jgi:5-methylthioadenosine/S-adenosylhomocysteine deaminase